LSADLAQTLSEDQTAQNPIAAGEFPVSLARELVPLFLIISCVGAWLLGWPILILHVLRLLVGLAAARGKSFLPPAFTSLLTSLWSGLGSGLAVVMGALWVSAAAAPTQPILFLALSVAVIFGLVEWSLLRRPVKVGG
jgi:4-hydroxybenzoate polyprenyltransferase